MDTRLPRRPMAGLVIPLLIATVLAAVGALALWTVRDQLPQHIATHWGLDGTPDGFGTLSGTIITGIVLTIALPASCALLGLAMHQEAVMGGVAVGLAVFLAAVSFGTAYQQRGLEDASAAPLSNASFLLPIVIAIAAGVAIGLLLRRPLPSRETRHEVPVAGAEALLWAGQLRRGKTGAIVLTVAAAGVMVLAAVLWALSGLWFVFVIGLLLLATIPLMYAGVMIDRDGVRVVAFGRIALRRIPLSNIESAIVTTVSCMGDYGGWGLRGGFDGSWGWVTADGQALRIKRPGRGDFVLTVDDADGAAHVLNALVGAPSTT